MRDMEFRGKRTDKGEWLYGYIYRCGWTGKENAYIVPNWPHLIEVDPSTVGQYTGLKDKNGTKIFEGDIVKRFLLGQMYIFQIVYDNGLTSFIGQAGKKFTTFDYDPAEFDSAEFEVVGNIHDNPELLRGNDNVTGEEM